MRKINTVGIVSLSSGMLGEDFARAQRELGVKRLEAYGLRVKFMPNALRGIAALNAHPEARAADLIAAFQDPEVDLIMTAIGGDDTYRLLPYLFDGGALENAVTDKIFLGFSDTTVNHLMLHKAGLRTFYGQSFLSDVCELDSEMLPYTRRYFEELLRTGRIGCVTPSDTWYEERTDFGPGCLGTPRKAHPNGGFELWQGPPRFSGKILGGCIDTLYDLFDGERYADSPVLAARYGLFPGPEDWRGRILLIESSEEKMPPEKYERAAEFLKEAGVFSAVSGVLVGKPMDGCFAAEYREALLRVIDAPRLPVLANLSIGHAAPRCILPFGVEARVDFEEQTIRFIWE